MSKYDTSGLDIEIVHTDEYLIEGEAPAYALRTKRNASDHPGRQTGQRRKGTGRDAWDPPVE